MADLGVSDEQELLTDIPTLVVTLGEKGARVVTESGPIDVPAYLVKSVDTTVAGDAFNGALAVALARGDSLKDSVTFANATAALTVTKLGAQTSLPALPVVKEFLASENLDRR